MAHPQSVIPLWINNWRPTFYSSLTVKEETSFNSNIGFWRPEFQRLASALNQYKNFNRQEQIQRLFFAGYGYAAMVQLYGITSSYMNLLRANDIYGVNGFVDATLARPANYYNDATVDPETGTSSSPRMNDSVNVVSSAASAEQPPDTKSMINAVQSKQFELLFTDLPVLASVNKDSMKSLFFDSLGWRSVFENLNVGNLQIP